MKNTTLLKKIVLEVILTTAICAQTFARDEITCPDGTVIGSKCWTCGNTCTATLDLSGKLSISGSGSMKSYNDSYDKGWALTTAPWREEVENITSVEVKGVSNVSQMALLGLKNVATVNVMAPVQSLAFCSIDAMDNLTSVYLAPSVTSVGGWALANNPRLTNVYVSDTTQFNNDSLNYSGHATKYKYEKNGDLLLLYEADGTTLSGVYTGFDALVENKKGTRHDSYNIDDDGNVSILNTDGNIIAKYTADGNLLASYLYSADGSASIYNANGKLIGLQGKRILTVEEASALVKGDKNTFKLKYR